MFRKYCSILLVGALSVGFVFADDDDENRRENAEEMREKYRERYDDDRDDDREELEKKQKKDKHKYDKHSKEAKGKHKDKAKKSDGMHGRDWAAEKGKKQGWEEGKSAKDRDHDHDHESGHDDESPKPQDPEHDVAEPQDPEQTLRDMAKDSAARKVGAEKGSATEALIHMGTDAVIDRAKGDGGQSQ